jgi:hypothetical protein
MSSLVLQDSRLFHSPTSWIKPNAFATDRLNGHGLLFFDELIDAGLHQSYRPFAFF